jgi:hypothetical protein
MKKRDLYRRDIVSVLLVHKVIFALRNIEAYKGDLIGLELYERNEITYDHLFNFFDSRSHERMDCDRFLIRVVSHSSKLEILVRSFLAEYPVIFLLPNGVFNYSFSVEFSVFSEDINIENSDLVFRWVPESNNNLKFSSKGDYIYDWAKKFLSQLNEAA